MQGSRSRLLVAWVDGVQRRAGAVLCATGVLTLAVIAYSAVTLGVNTHHTAILSDELPFWKHYHEFAEVFPILDEALLVVIDAETASEARDAARTLAERLSEQPERYRDVYVPGGDPFFDRNALLYLETEEVEDLSDQLASVQPLLAAVSQDSSLASMASIRSRVSPRAAARVNTYAPRGSFARRSASASASSGSSATCAVSTRARWWVASSASVPIWPASRRGQAP